MISLENLLARADRQADQATDSILRQAIEGLAKRHARGLNGCDCEYCKALRIYTRLKIDLHHATKHDTGYGAWEDITKLEDLVREAKERKDYYL